MPIFGSRKIEELPALPDGPWSVSEGVYDGRPIIVRLNEGLLPLAGDRRFPVRAAMAIQSNAVDDRGFPSTRDLEKLDRFEDEFVERFCADDRTLLAAVVTTNGMREFVFYTGDEGAFRTSFSEWARTPKSHRIQMTVSRDPKWSVFRTLVEMAAGRG